MGAQYGSTNAQNRLGVSFFGNEGLVVSLSGRICSFCKGSKVGTCLSDLTLGNPMILAGSPCFPDPDAADPVEALNRLAPWVGEVAVELEEAPRLAGDPGP